MYKMAARGLPEDLEYNEFYRALQTQYLALYERAQADCWLVCIPSSSSLPPTSDFSYSFVSAHLLEPSKLYRDEYTTILSSGKRKKWSLEYNRLKATDGSYTVRVLSEELAYNKSFQHYRMLVIDRPLVEGTQKRRKTVVMEDLLTPKRTVKEQLELLANFQKHSEIKYEVDKRIQMFRENYMVLEGFLSDAASRIENLVKQAYTSYLHEHQSDKRIHDRRIQEMIWVAVESYIVTQLHGKVYPKIISRYQKENKTFHERCRDLSSHFTPSALGLPGDYSCPYKETIAKLNKLKDSSSSINKLYCLQEAMDNIQVDVQDHFKYSLRIGEPTPLPSDDLISLLATIIVQANLLTFPSDVYYIENFYWPFSDGEKLSFVLVTVRAATEYIKSSDVDKYLSQTRQRRTSGSSNSRTAPSLTPPLSTVSMVPPSLLKLHDEEEKREEPSLDETLAKLRHLKMIDDGIKSGGSKTERKEERKESFFDRLMNDDGIMTSSDFPSPPR